MTRTQQSERDAALRQDAPNMKLGELCAKYSLGKSSVFKKTVALGVHYKHAPRGRGCIVDWSAVTLAARSHSYSELEQIFPDVAPSSLRGHVARHGGIGMRENVRIRCNVPSKQLNILADLRDQPDHSYKQIGVKYKVSREKVSQIAFHGRALGFLPNRPTE